jgi:hypothetical protein
MLRAEPDLLEAAISQAAALSGVPPDHVEKDFWLTECLRGMADYSSSHGVPLLLKGGTSLSKAFRLIERFSEDADMLVIFGDLSKTRREKHLKGLVAGAESATGLSATSDPAVADTGVTRVVTLDYPYSVVPSSVPPEVKVELHTAGGGYPRRRVELRSLLSEHWDAIAGTGPADAYLELGRFEIDVLEPCRTLVEKLVLLHEAHTRDGGTATERKNATVRHYYDVWRLLSDPGILEALDHYDVTTLARDVRAYSLVAGYQAVSRPPDGFATSPAFRLPPTRATNRAYDLIVAQLVWPGGSTPSLDACIGQVHMAADRL